MKSRLKYWIHSGTWFCNRAGNEMCCWGDTKEEAKANWISFKKESNEENFMMWQPIETAPTDDTPVDLWRDGVRLISMRFVNLGKGNTFFEAIESGYSCVRDASHWMPVPTDPYEAKDEVDEKNKAYPIGFHSKKESNEENFMMWQPIETAPTDDTPVDLWRDGVRLINMRLVNLGNGNTFFEAIESGYSCVRDASHWMPVPRDPYEAKDAVDEKNKAYPIGEDVLLAAAKVKFGDGVEIGAQSFVDSEVVRVGIALESGNISFGSNFYFKEGVFR